MLDFKKWQDAAPALRFFEEFSKIPHGSGNTKKIADYLENFAKERKLFCVRDGADNVVIRKAASPGYESRPTVIFQGHTDMVLDKKSDCPLDMKKDPIELYIDGDFLRARGTTLGGDDGVALAYALAVLDSDEIPHPEFEAVFTSDEEIGLIGASALDTSFLNGKTMINIDSDVEGVFTVGCAGGLRLDARLPVKRSPYGKYTYELSLDGCRGGHSGVEIDKGRLNAIKELNCALSLIDGARLVSVFGGNMDNAIPRSAVFVFKSDKKIGISDSAFEAFIAERKRIEPDLFLELKELEKGDTPLDEASHNALTAAIEKTPFGVVAMSRDIPDLPETSINLGIIRSEDDCVNITYSIRSSSESEKDKLKAKVRTIWENSGAQLSERGEYPAWEYKKDSHLRDTLCEIYRQTYQKEAKVITIHAGLECGIFSNKIPGLDCVSLGPDNFDIHTTEERLSLSSFARIWDFLKTVLKNI